MSSLISAIEFVAQAPAAAPAPGQQQGFPTWMILGYGLLFAAMYFLMIAPQRKKQKEHERMMKALQSGDEIVSTGGIFGTITNVKDDRFVVRIADNTKIELGKGFVSQVLKRGDSEKK